VNPLTAGAVSAFFSREADQNALIQANRCVGLMYSRACANA
jgi:hypothetical protein